MAYLPHMGLQGDASTSYLPSHEAAPKQMATFATLVSTIEGEWAEVDRQLQGPSLALARLHLETTALVRALHGNHRLAAVGQTSSEDDRQDLTAANLTKSSTTLPHESSTRSQRKRSKAARAAFQHQQMASARLLSLETNLMSLKDHAARLQLLGEGIVQTAASVACELALVGQHVLQLKDSALQQPQTYSYTVDPMVQSEIGPSLFPDPPSPMSSATSSSDSEFGQRDGPGGDDQGEAEAEEEQDDSEKAITVWQDEDGGELEVGGGGLLTPMVLEGSPRFALTDYFQNWQASPSSLAHPSKSFSRPEDAVNARELDMDANADDDDVEAILPRLTLKRGSSSLGHSFQPTIAKSARLSCTST